MVVLTMGLFRVKTRLLRFCIILVLIPFGQVKATEVCQPRPTDLIFLLDASGSVQPLNFNKLVDFLANVVNSIEVGADKIQIGLAEFSTDVTPVIKLNDFYNNFDVVSAIRTSLFSGGKTQTALALKYAREELLSPANGRRLNAQAVVVVLTDGRSTEHNDTIVQAQLLKDTGALVISVGIGIRVDSTELATIASGPHYVLNVNSFNLLDTVQQKIVNTTTSCQDVTTPTTTTTTMTTAIAQTVAPIPGIKCYNCSGNLCRFSLPSYVITCPDVTPYCMNTYAQEAGTPPTIVKRCVSVDECREKWLEQTSDQGKCVNLDPASTQRKVCHFCCVKDECNKATRPADSTLYN